MNQFKEALLDELVAYAQRPAPSALTTPTRRRQIAWTASLAGAGVAAAATAVLTVHVQPEPAPEKAAYSVQQQPNGTVRVTFRELADPEAVTRDLRAAGVWAQVVQLAEPGSCATTPGGLSIRRFRHQWIKVGMPDSFPGHDINDVLQDWTAEGMTIDPAKIPEGAVLFIVEDIEPERGRDGVTFGVNLTRDPAPTCYEAAGAGDLSTMPPTQPNSS